MLNSRNFVLAGVAGLVLATAGCQAGEKRNVVSLEHEVGPVERYVPEHMAGGGSDRQASSRSAAPALHAPTEATRLEKANQGQVWRAGAWVNDVPAAVAYVRQAEASRARAAADAAELAASRARDPRLGTRERDMKLAEQDGALMIASTGQGLSPMNFVTGATRDEAGNFTSCGRFSAQAFAAAVREHNLSCSARISMLRGVYAHFVSFTSDTSTANRANRSAAGVALADLDEQLTALSGPRHEAFKAAILRITPAASPALAPCENPDDE